MTGGAVTGCIHDLDLGPSAGAKPGAPPPAGASWRCFQGLGRRTLSQVLAGVLRGLPGWGGLPTGPPAATALSTTGRWSQHSRAEPPLPARPACYVLRDSA